jgi:hypothetical protein
MLKRNLLVAVLILCWGNCSYAQDPIPAGIVEGFPALLKAPRKEMPGDAELKRLLTARFNATLDVVIPHWVEYYRNRPNSLVNLLGASRRLMRAGLEVNETAAQKLEFLTEMVEFANKMEAIARKRERAVPDELAAQLEFRLEVAIERMRIEESNKAKMPKADQPSAVR